MENEGEKKEVHDFWNRASCGEELYLSVPIELIFF
jgi:hypothetical protein